MPTVEEIARVCHEANAALCRVVGDHSQASWDEAPDWQRASTIRGVKHALADPGATPEGLHDSWACEKIAEGWVYGHEKDPQARTHPCLVHYERLPHHQRLKDHLFLAVVRALSVPE